MGPPNKPDKPGDTRSLDEVMADLEKSTLRSTPPPTPKDDGSAFKNPLETHDDRVESGSHPRSNSRTMKIPPANTQPIPDKSEKSFMEKISESLKRAMALDIRDLLKKIFRRS